MIIVQLPLLLSVKWIEIKLWATRTKDQIDPPNVVVDRANSFLLRKYGTHEW
jgi:hypothetical protein